MAERPDFHDTQKWVTQPGNWIFDEHSRKFKNKKTGLLENVVFDKTRLQRIARKMNALDEAGVFCPLTSGHTLDDEYDDEGRLTYKALEKDQPEPVGYVEGYEVDWHPEFQRWAIKAKEFHVRREKYQEAASYPHKSVEIWLDKDQFHPIALLRRTPQRDLGSWTYRRQGHLVLRYSMADNFDDADPKPRPPMGGGGGMGGGDDLGDEDMGDDSPPVKDPVAAPNEGMGDEGPEGVPPELFHHISESLKYLCSSGMMAKYMGNSGGGSLGDAPVPGNPPAPPLKPNDAERMRRSTAEQTVLKLQREMQTRADAQDARLNRLEGENKNLKYERDLQETERLLDQVEAKVVIDRAYEAELMMDMASEKRQHADKLIRHGRVDPTRKPLVNTNTAKPKLNRNGPPGQQTVRVSGGVESGKVGEDVADEAETNRVLAYMRENKMAGDGAFEKAKKALRKGTGEDD